MEIDSIIARLGEMKSYCDTEIDKMACTEAVNIIFALKEGGVETVEAAKDLVYDYNGLAKQYQAMHQRFGTAGRAVHKDGLWHCPSCNRRVNPGHSFCRWCGKKMGWHISGRGGRR